MIYMLDIMREVAMRQCPVSAGYSSAVADASVLVAVAVMGFSDM